MKESRVKQTRKDHRCTYCNAVIPKGSRNVNVESGIYDNIPFRYYCCAACKPLIHEFYEWCNGECDNINIWFEEFLAERRASKL